MRKHRNVKLLIQNKNNMLFSVVIFISIALRFYLDNIGLGATGSVFLILFFVFTLNQYRFLEIRTAILLLVTCCTLLVSFFNAWVIHDAPIESVSPIIRYAAYGLTYIIARRALSVRNAVCIVLLLIFSEIAIALLQKILLFQPRPRGTLINNNHLMYLLIIPASLFLSYFQRPIFFAAIVIVAFFLGGVGGSIALLAVLGTYTLFMARGLRRLIGSGLVITSVILFPFAFSDRFQEFESQSEILQRLESGQSGGGSSLAWRIVTWDRIINDIFEHNGAIWGRGIGYTSSVSSYQTTATSFDPHNDYILVFAEFGLVGLFFFCLILLRYIFRFYRSWIIYGDRMAGTLFLSLIAICIGMFSGNLATQSTLWLCFFALAGASAHNIENSLLERTKQPQLPFLLST